MRISFVNVNDSKEIFYYDIEEERTVGIETHLLLPGALKVSVPSKSWAEWSSRWRKMNVYENSLKAAFASFSVMVLRGDGAFIPVAVAGPGKTEKSIRVRVKAELYPRSVDEEITEHTITVPRSMLVEHDGVPHLPRWMIKKTLRERILKRKTWPKVVGNGVWPDAQQFWDDCFRPALDILDRIEREKKIANEIEDQRRRQARTALQVREAPPPPKVKAPPAYRRLPMVQVSGLEYDEWVSVGTGKDKKRKKVVIEVGEAKLYFSEKQVVIETPTGQTIRKAQTNVRYASELTQ